jgi:hypothetical protein
LSFEEEDKANGVDEMAVVDQEERSETNQAGVENEAVAGAWKESSRWQSSGAI